MNEFSSNLLGYIPVVLPHILERDELIGKFEKGLNELISLSNGIKIKHENDFEMVLNSVLVKDINELPIYKQLWEDSPSPYRDFWFIEISSTVIFSEADVENYIGDFFNQPLSVKADIYKSHAALEIEKIANELLLAINIAKCGLIQSSKGLVLYDNTPLKSYIIGTQNLFFEAKKQSTKIGWPQIEDLELKKVWNWLISFDFFNRSIGEGRIGRAIAALTHLLKDEIHEIEGINLDIIWILIGLESLYGNGNVGLRNQLIEKSRTFLGEPKKSKNLFTKSYNLRSRVIHGDIDLPFRFCMYEAVEKYEKLFSDLGEARITALSLLLSTIQRLIVEGKRDLAFQYQIL